MNSTQNLKWKNNMELLKQANGNLPRTEGKKKDMIEEASIHYGNFLKALGFDYELDENSKDTPMRVAKAWINDIISGCVDNEPKITTFPSNGYDGLICETGINVTSLCSHHNLPFTGYCSIGYVPGDKVIGLSKINRVVNFYGRRPQIQEGLTQQIWEYLDKKLEGNKGVIVYISAKHSCCSNRGIKDRTSSMTTSKSSGVFMEKDNLVRMEFFEALKLNGIQL